MSPRPTSSGVANVRISNFATVDGSGVLNGADAVTRPYATPQTWTLLPGDGVKTVYVQWQDSLGTWSAVSSDTITLDSVNTTYTEVTPVRVLDSRVNNPAGAHIFSHGVPQSFQVAGRTIGAVTIPADAVAITGNLTVVGSTAEGFVALGPDVPVAPDVVHDQLPQGRHSGERRLRSARRRRQAGGDLSRQRLQPGRARRPISSST